MKKQLEKQLEKQTEMNKSQEKDHFKRETISKDTCREVECICDNPSVTPK